MIRNLKYFVVAFLLCASLAFGQTALTTTTLTANITNRQLIIPVTATTGMAVPANAGVAQGGIGSPASYTSSILYVDKEAMQIAAINGLNVTVNRAFMGTKMAAHRNAAVLTVMPRVATYSYDPTGQCQRSLLPYVPVINPLTGHKFDCLGLTTAGQWFRTNSPGNNLGQAGTTVSSATSITPTGLFFVVSGTTAVATIVVPAGFTAGMYIDINPSGIFATTTADNIGLVTSATVVGRILRMTWDGVSKWWPSYVS